MCGALLDIHGAAAVKWEIQVSIWQKALVSHGPCSPVAFGVVRKEDVRYKPPEHVTLWTLTLFLLLSDAWGTEWPRGNYQNRLINRCMTASVTRVMADRCWRMLLLSLIWSHKHSERWSKSQPLRLYRSNLQNVFSLPRPASPERLWKQNKQKRRESIDRSGLSL